MRITLGRYHPDNTLEHFRPRVDPAWELVSMGSWSQSTYHSGEVSYWLANPQPGLWLLQVGAWTKDEDQYNEPTDYNRIVAVGEDAAPGLKAKQAARLLYEAWVASKQGHAIEEQRHAGLLDLDRDPTAPEPEDVLAALPNDAARCQAVAEDVAKRYNEFSDIPATELAELLGIVPGESAERIHLCSIDEDATAEWLQEELSQGEGDGSNMLEKVLSATRRKALRRYLTKVEEGEDVDDFAVTPRELKKLAPLRARQRLEDGEIDLAWSYDSALAPDGTKLTFVFNVGEDGEIEDCRFTPYDRPKLPCPDDYVWE